MDRGSRSPKSESNQRGGSSDPCSSRPNPFEQDDDTSRKRRRTSLNTEPSRCLTAEPTDPDAMADDSDSQLRKSPEPLDPDSVPLTSTLSKSPTSSTTLSTHTARVDAAADTIADAESVLPKSTMPMDTTQDTAEAEAPVPAPAPDTPTATRPQTPTHEPEPVPAGTPNNVALRLRKDDQQVASDESPATGNTLAPPPQTERLQDVVGLSTAVDAATSALALDAHSPATPVSVDNDDNGASPPVVIVDVSSSDDDSVIEGETVQLLTETGTPGARADMPSPPMVDPTPKFPYYENDNIRDHIYRMSGYLFTDKNLARETHEWIDNYLTFVQHSSIDTLRNSYLTYHQLWIALPSLVLNNTVVLRIPGYDLPSGSPIRSGVSLFCRSFARLTAQFVQFDTKAQDMPCLVSPPFVTALASMTERRSLAEEDRMETPFADDDIYATLFAFLKYNRAPPNGTLIPLMHLLEAQTRVPLCAQAVDNAFTMVTLMSSLTREFYRKLTRSVLPANIAANFRSRLVLGLQALDACRSMLETAIKDHADFLNSEQAAQQIIALGELLYVSLALDSSRAASFAADSIEAYPEIHPNQLPDAFVVNWKLNVFSGLVKHSQMSLRLMAVDNLAAELVALWRRYSDQGSVRSIVRYVADQVLASDVVAYFLSPTCHPEVTERSFNVIGFLAISQTYTNAETDLFWKSVLAAQDPTNLLKMMADVVPYFSYDTAVYFCKRFMDVPIAALNTAYMRNLCLVVFRQLLLPNAPRPDTLDQFILFKVCLHYIRVLSAPAEDGSTKYPEVLEFFTERLDDVLQQLGVADMPSQRQALYRACISGIDSKSDVVLGSLSAIRIINKYGGGGLTDLDTLMSNESFTKMLVDNLEHAIERMPSSARITVLNGPVCQARRDFLYYVLSDYSSNLSPSLSSRLWDLMFGKSAACEDDRNASWLILTSFCSGEAVQRDNPFLLQVLNTYIPTLPIDCFCQGLLSFLQEWLVPELMDPACDLLIAEATREAAERTQDGADASTPRKTANSIALEQLWQIVLTTPTNTIEHGAIHLLVKQVYIDSRAVTRSTPENMRLIHTALIERCLRQISSAAKMLESLNKAAEDTTDAEKALQTQKHGLLFLRSVRVLQQFLQQYREAFPHMSHVKPEVTQHGESARLKYQAFDGAQQTQVAPLSIGRRNTARFLFESLKEATGFEHCKVYVHGGLFEPQDMSQSLEELKIHDCHLLVRRAENTATSSVYPAEGSLDVEGAILDHFQELWESLGLSEELASEVYELLVHLAVGDNMFTLFERPGMSYQDVLHANQPYKSLYALHALREYLVTRLKEDGRSSVSLSKEDGDMDGDRQRKDSTAAATAETTSPLSPEVAAKIGTSDGSADTRMTTPDGSTGSTRSMGSKSSLGNAVYTPRSKSNEMEMEDQAGETDKQIEKEDASSAWNHALLTTAHLITSAICDPSTTRVPKDNIALQTDLHLKILQLLDLVLVGSSCNAAVQEKLDASLLSHLLTMLSTTLDYPPTQASMSLIDLLLRTVIDASSLNRSFWTAFQEHAQTKELIARLLLTDDRLPVRELAESHIGRRAVFGGSEMGVEAVSLAEFQQFFMPLIVELIPEAIRQPAKCEGVFNLIEGCFTNPLSTGVPLSSKALLSETAQLLLQYDTLEDATQPEVGDCAMYGLARMLELVYHAAQGAGELPRDFVDRLFWKHLFPAWQQGSRRNSVTSNTDMTLAGETISPSSQDLHIVQSSRTRTILMKLTLAIADDDPRQLRKLVKNLDQLVPAEPSSEDDSLYEYELAPIFDRTRALRAPCGYVGLRNLSNTCYFNSLLTQLFMNVEFRRFIIQVDPTNEDADSMVFQTRLLFSYMQNSVRRFLDTQSCTNTIKTYDNGPIDISIQMDVDEFFNLLFDRWEAQMPTAGAKRQLRSFYGGQIVQQIRSHQCEHVSERMEPFSAIQCDIKGKSNLMESLEAYVEGEVMEGENKYKCSDCNEHVVATKRACLKEVPDHLIFHLKRFEFNLRNGTRNKINDHFSFPHEIDMRPYTIEHLSNPEKEQTPDMFELVGVLVHAGTAESGHYYSFIRERPSTKPQGSWVEFNDDTVSDWHPGKMEAQCFGGFDFRPPLASYGNDSGEVIEKSYSAYMLFYQRRSALASEQAALEQTGLASPRKVDVLSAVAHHIHRENTQLLRRHVLFEPQHVPFVSKVLVQVQRMQPDGQCSSGHVVENRALQMALGHLDQVTTHTRDLPDFFSLLNSIEYMASKCALCSLAVYDYFGARPQVFHQMVQRCQDTGVREDVGKLVITVLENVRAAFTQNYYSMPVVELDAEGNILASVGHIDEDGDLYMDGEGGDSIDGAAQDDQVVAAHTSGTTTQRNPLGMVHNCTILLHAQGLIRQLWDHTHVLIRTWPETFGFMYMFVSLGRAEVAAFMDADGLRKALEVITADAALGGQSMQTNRLLLNLDRRQATRPVSYDNLISLISTVMAGMYLELDSQSVAPAPLHVEDGVCRFARYLENPNGDLPMLKPEFNMIALDWPSQVAGPGVNIFVDKLVGLNQNKAQTEAIIVRLMRRHPAMKKMVFLTLKSGLDAFSVKHQLPYVWAAVAYVRCADAADVSGLMMAMAIAEQCRVLTNNINRRGYFEALRALFYDSGNRRFANDGGTATAKEEAEATEAEADSAKDAEGADVPADTATPPFNINLLEESLRIVLIWAPGLLAYYEPRVNEDVEEFLGDVLYGGGPDVQFDDADGGAARTALLRTMTRQFGVELLTYLRDTCLLTRMRIHVRVVRSIERIVGALEPYFASESETTGDGDTTEDADTIQYRELLPVVAELSRPMPPPADADDLEDEYESGVDEGDWNEDSSVEDDSNISMNMGGGLDADIV